jgi:hypothetical protein
MTAQVAETLYLRGERLMLFTCPLESYWQQHPPRLELAAPNTACSRGYAGTWEIADGYLYLIALDEALHADFTLENLFPGSAGRVRADWFTSTLRCPQGELLDYFHGGFLSTYERDLRIEIDHGRVVSERVQVNTLEPDPLREAEREIERRARETRTKKQ